MEELFGKMAESGSNMPSLGLLSLAAVLKREGHDVSIIEPTVMNMDLDAAIKKIMLLNPKYVGITAPTILIYQAARLARELKKADDKIITLIGGPHITAIPAETMSAFPEFDIGCIGEGEETAVELIPALENGSALKNVKGIVIREEGKVLVTPPRPFMQDLDKLPFPAWELLEGFPRGYKPTAHTYRHLPVATLVTSRGCPNQCNFCDTSVFGRRYRYHSAQYVYRMMDMLYRAYGVREITFYDDAITTNRQRIMELCALLRESRMKMAWSCFSRVNNVDKEMLKLMKETGCWEIGYGIESGSQQILDTMNKRITLDQIRDAVRLTKEAGISPKGFFIFGSFLETKETIRQTTDFAKELMLDVFHVTHFTPFPGSAAFAEADRYGAFEKDWRKMNMLKVCFIPKGLTVRELEDSQRKAFLEFYLRPRIAFEEIKGIFRDPVSSLIRIFRGLHSLISIFFSKGQDD